METNRSIFLALSKIAKIATSKVSMYSIDDPYSHPPFLRFRFENIDKEDEKYNFLRDVFVNFKGNLEWNLMTKSESSNFIIIPDIFSDDLEKDFYNQEYYREKFTLLEYHQLIDNAIEDIPNLAKYITLEYNKKVDYLCFNEII
ncbi:hypothetical protein [Flavobacterium sp. ENC]|uniref:hypothetical protein n=1 Tax=Flavobacterium sp. ENC TaxID=2897330 RepID=UPI001E2FB9E8|nr:hypothetical protein [Flavobacterium sp. ENC]MCD0465972.1 hypothetical protein [Flavobacterium sp. ENC]